MALDEFFEQLKAIVNDTMTVSPASALERWNVGIDNGDNIVISGYVDFATGEAKIRSSILTPSPEPNDPQWRSGPYNPKQDA